MYNKLRIYIKENFNEQDRYLIYVMAAIWIVNAVASFAEWNVVYDLLSPLCAILAVILMARGIPSVGKHWISAFYFLFGIFFWVVSDSLVIVYSYFIPGDDVLVAIADALYLAPNYVFSLAFFLYMFSDFKKNERIILTYSAVTALILVIATAYSFSLYDVGLAGYSSSVGVSALTYFTGVGFNAFMIFFYFLIRGIRGMNRSRGIIIGALFFYNILEFRYGYFMANFRDPESPVLDILYLSCVIAISLAHRDPSMKEK